MTEIENGASNVTGSVTPELLSRIEDLLGSRRAALKLLIINQGISVDGAALQEGIEGYPAGFRTKRAKVRHRVVDGEFVDTEQRDVPWIPTEIRISLPGGDSVAKVNYHPGSCFRVEVQESGPGLVCKELDIELSCSMMPIVGSSLTEVNGFPAHAWVQLLGADRIGILAWMGCANWFDRQQCRFCDSCASRPGVKRALPSLNPLSRKYRNEDETYRHEGWWSSIRDGLLDGAGAAYRLLMTDPLITPHRHVHVMAGNLMDVDFEWNAVLELAAHLDSISALADVDSYLNLIPPPDPDHLRRARDLGIGKVIFNMEVFGEEAFAEVCPGKHRLVPYPMFLERMKQAAGVFGEGNVYCGFVFGAQPVPDLEEGIRLLADHGIVADYSSFTPKAGTPWAKRPRPDILETARFAGFLSRLNAKHGYRPMYCALSARSSILNEIYEGMSGQ